MVEGDSLRERALDAWRNRDEIARRERIAQAAARLSALLRSRLNVYVEPESDTIEVDDLTFARVIHLIRTPDRDEEREELNLVWTCPECERPVLGSDITDLQELGRQLEAGIPPHKHVQRQPEGGEKG